MGRLLLLDGVYIAVFQVLLLKLLRNVSRVVCTLVLKLGPLYNVVRRVLLEHYLRIDWPLGLLELLHVAAFTLEWLLFPEFPRVILQLLVDDLRRLPDLLNKTPLVRSIKALGKRAFFGLFVVVWELLKPGDLIFFEVDSVVAPDVLVFVL